VLYLHLTVLTKESTIDDVEDVLDRVKENGMGVASIKGTFISQLFLVRFVTSYRTDMMKLYHRVVKYKFSDLLCVNISL